MIAKFERERALVELLIRRHGLAAGRYIDPNKEARDETGADVIAIVGGRRIGIQVTQLDTGDLRGRARASEKAVWNDAQECGYSTYGSWAQNDPSKLVAAIARAVTSKMQQIVGCDEAWLLISASLPEMGTLASTFVITQWLPADALNAATISKLAACNYTYAFLHVLVGNDDALYVWSRGGKWQKQTQQVGNQAKEVFELLDNPSELREWLSDPDGKADREAEKCLREFRERREQGQQSEEPTLQKASEPTRNPFYPGKWYTVGELRRVAAQLQSARQMDPALSAMMRVQSQRWAKDWTEELHALKVLADHKAFADADTFCWTPSDAADFIVHVGEGEPINIQCTMAYAEWPDSVAKQGGHLHKLEMKQSNKEGFAFLGGRITEPTVLDPETDALAWRAGIAKALKNKLRREYTGLHLAIFAQGCAVHMIETPLEQVALSAIDEADKEECQRIFSRLYVFDAQAGVFFEM